MRLDQACRNVCGVCGMGHTHPSIHIACAPRFLWNKGVVQAKHTHTHTHTHTHASIEDHTLSKLVNTVKMVMKFNE